MSYHLDIQYSRKFEFISSLHSYICRKSHKKIDLTPNWAQKIKQQLTPDLSAMLDELEVNGDWKFSYLVILLSKGMNEIKEVIAWLQNMSVGELYELFAPYGNQFPANMGEFQQRMITVFSEWNRQYFELSDPAIHDALLVHLEERRTAMGHMKQEAFIDDTTNGLVFEPVSGVDKLLLVPQYHFQPMNVIIQYGDVLFCHYSSRTDIGEEDFMPMHDFRTIRALSEKSRLRILRYLHHGPRSFIEIVREMNLSKGITHDHIAKLRSAGLIYVHFQGETVTEYSLRRKALNEIQSKLLDYIEK